MIKGPILFITGAGASVDSGLPTYRGKGGVYEGGGNPEDDLSISVWEKYPQTTWTRLKPLVAEARKATPGPTYEMIEKIGQMYATTIYTQNVDGFSKKVCGDVWEMHGNLETMDCERCREIFPLDHEKPECPQCDKLCKPNIVFYGEGIRYKTSHHGLNYFKTALVIGTTLQFEYLQKMINTLKSKGCTVIHINPDPAYSVGKGEILMRMKSANALKLLFNL